MFENDCQYVMYQVEVVVVVLCRLASLYWIWTSDGRRWKLNIQVTKKYLYHIHTIIHLLTPKMSHFHIQQTNDKKFHKSFQEH